MLNPIRTWYADDGDERAEVRADELRDINARVAQLEGQREATERMLFALRKEVAAAKAENALLLERAQVWDAVEKIDNWRDSHLLDEIYISTGSKWHAGGDSALLGKGNGALEMLWRGLWEPRSDDDVTIESPSLREVIIALAAKLDEETPNATD